MAWTLGFYPAAFKQYAISRWPFLMQNPCSTSLICDSLHPSKVVSLPENNLQIRGNMHSVYSAPPLGQCLPRLWTIFKGAHSWGPFEMLNISCSRGIIAGFDYELHKPGNPFTSYLIPSPPPTPPPPHTHTCNTHTHESRVLQDGVQCPQRRWIPFVKFISNYWLMW